MDFQWGMHKIVTGLKEFLDVYLDMRVTLESLFMETTDNHVFDVIGESVCPHKAKTAAYERIRVSDGGMLLSCCVRLLYGGNMVEHKSYQNDAYGSNPDVDKLYIEKIDAFSKEAHAYDYKNHTTSLIICDRTESSVPVIRWICPEHLYHLDGSLEIGGIGGVGSISELPPIPEYTYREYDFADLYAMAYKYWRDYDEEEHLTKVHAKGTIAYTPYGKPEQTISFDKEYEHFGEFCESLLTFDKELQSNELEDKWEEQAELSIYLMDELAALFAVENYFAFHVEYDKKSCKEHNFCYLERALHEQESFMGYIQVLSKALPAVDERVLIKAFMDLQADEEQTPLSILRQYYPSRYGKGIRPGEVYFAMVNYASLEFLGGNPKDALVNLFTEKEQYSMGELLLKYSTLTCSFRELDGAYYSDRNSHVEAYLKGNTYTQNGNEYMHAWNGDALLVKVSHISDSGMPMTEVVDTL